MTISSCHKPCMCTVCEGHGRCNGPGIGDIPLCQGAIDVEPVVRISIRRFPRKCGSGRRNQRAGGRSIEGDRRNRWNKIKIFTIPPSARAPRSMHEGRWNGKHERPITIHGEKLACGSWIGYIARIPRNAIDGEIVLPRSTSIALCPIERRRERGFH